MSQDTSYTTLDPLCFTPRDKNGEDPWNSKSRVDFRPATANIDTRQKSIKKIRSDTSIKSRLSSPRSRPSSQGSSQRFPLHEITQMNRELVDARQKGEMPKTKASPLDEDALAEDYASLLQLREARGDSEKPASEEYTQARVDVARKVKERDDRSDHESRDREAQRRVHDYLYSAKKEHLFLSESTSPRTTPPHSAVFPLDGGGRLVEQLYDIVQQASEYFDATEPFLDTLDHHDVAFTKLVRDMRSMCKHFQDIQEQMQDSHHHTAATHQYLQQYFHQSMTSQYHALQENLSSAHALATKLNKLMEPQAEAMQASTENLALQTGIITHLSEQLRIMPSIIQQAVHQTVQQEVRAATQHIMEAQQEAMLSLLKPQSHPTPPRERISFDWKRSVLVSRLKGLFRVQSCSG